MAETHGERRQAGAGEGAPTCPANNVAGREQRKDATGGEASPSPSALALGEGPARRGAPLPAAFNRVVGRLLRLCAVWAGCRMSNGRVYIGM